MSDAENGGVIEAEGRNNLEVYEERLVFISRGPGVMDEVLALVPISFPKSYTKADFRKGVKELRVREVRNFAPDEATALRLRALRPVDEGTLRLLEQQVFE